MPRLDTDLNAIRPTSPSFDPAVKVTVAGAGCFSPAGSTDFTPTSVAVTGLSSSLPSILCLSVAVTSLTSSGSTSPLFGSMISSTHLPDFQSFSASLAAAVTIVSTNTDIVPKNPAC